MHSDESLARLISRLPIKTDEQRLAFLGLSSEKLAKINHAKRREKYIRYKYLLTELQISAFCRKYNKNEKEILNQLDESYEKILSLSTKQVNGSSESYSEFSVGLQDLDLRSIYKEENPIDDTMNATIIVTGTKDAGVEPGFLSGLIEDLVLFLQQILPDRKSRLDYFNNHPNFEEIYKLHENSLPKYMVKGDYKLSTDGMVRPNDEDLKRTNFTRGVYDISGFLGDLWVNVYKKYKTGTPTEKNCEIVLETLAFDLARAAGMTVEEHTIYEGTFSKEPSKNAKYLPVQIENEIPKFMLKGKWVNNSTILAPIAGALPKTNHNYRVTPELLWQPEGIKFLSNNSIPDLASHYASFIIFGDYDGVGTGGQNKLVTSESRPDGEADKGVINHLVGIDFGHANREKNTLIAKMLPNLHIPAAAKIKNKNFSMFEDAPCSEIMKGAIVFAILSGKQFPESTLAQYDLEFRKKIASLKTGAFDQIFVDYIHKFKARMGVKPWNKAYYAEIVKKIEESKVIFDASVDEYLKKVGDKINLPPQIIDLTENIEKICLGAEHTSMRSPDNTVLLNHLRITNENEYVPWAVKEEKDSYKFSATFSSTRQAKRAYENLKKFSTDFIINGKEISLNCAKNNIQNQAKQLNEEVVKEVFHEKDFKYARLLKKERALANFIAVLNTELEDDFEFSFSNTASIGMTPTYLLKITSKENRQSPTLNSLFENFLNNSENSKERSLFFNFNTNENPLAKLKQFRTNYRLLKDTEETIKKLNRDYSSNLDLFIDWQTSEYYILNSENLDCALSGSIKDLTKNLIVISDQLSKLRDLQVKSEEKIQYLNNKFNQNIKVKINWKKRIYQFENLGTLTSKATALGDLETDLQTIEKELESRNLFVERNMKTVREINNNNLNIRLEIDWDTSTFIFSNTDNLVHNQPGDLSALENTLEDIKQTVQQRINFTNFFIEEISELNNTYDLNINLLFDWAAHTYSIQNTANLTSSNSGNVDQIETVIKSIKDTLEYRESFDQKQQQAIQQLNKNYDLNFELKIDWDSQSFTLIDKDNLANTNTGKITTLDKIISNLEKKYSDNLELTRQYQQLIRDFNKTYSLNLNLSFDWNNNTFKLINKDDFPKLLKENSLNQLPNVLKQLEKEFNHLFEQSLGLLVSDLDRSSNSFWDYSKKFANMYVSSEPTASKLSEIIIKPWLIKKEYIPEELEKLKENMKVRLNYIQLQLKLKESNSYSNEAILLKKSLKLLDLVMINTNNLLTETKTIDEMDSSQYTV